MSDSDSEYDGAEVYIKERKIVRRFGKPFSTDIEDTAEYASYEPLFMRVHNGAAQLLITCLGYKNMLEGQMGMVDFGDGNAQAVTALHNILKRKGISPRDTLCTFAGRRHNETFAAEFQHLGTPRAKVRQLELTIGDVSISWEYGVDITRGTLPHPAPSSSAQNYHVFQAVSQAYEYTVGTNIAMAVFAKQAATAESARIAGTSTRVVDPTHVYGAPDEISIYAGIITAVGEKFFVHDINSYRGCSGASVFLLDGSNAGMCIGVHIGSPVDIEPAVNLAIKIRETQTLISSPSVR
jgi:hypothetical protein